MAEYLTESAYMRWFRHYQTNLGYYIDLLDHLRLRVDILPHDAEVSDIEQHINEIDENLERVIPRLFTGNGNPLAGHEIFFENSKVLINLILRVFGRPDYFHGAYFEEKNRVMRIHQEFKFKDRLIEVRKMIEAVEEKFAKELEPEAPIETTPEAEAAPATAEGK